MLDRLVSIDWSTFATTVAIGSTVPGPTIRPPIRWERVEWDGGYLVRAVHDGPHVFRDGQCSCGVLDLGIVR